MKSTFRRWLPAIAQSPFGKSSSLHKTALGKAALSVAGFAVAGAALAGAAPTAAHATAGPSAASAATASTATPATQAAAPVAAAAAPAAAAPAVPPGQKALGYDFKLQPNYYYCGPAAVRIALTTQGKTPSQDDVAGRLGTTTNGTNSAEDTTRVLNSVTGTNFYKTRSIPGKTATAAEMDRLKEDVVHAISSGYGMVGNVAGTIRDTAGETHSYEGGHYLSVVGYTDGGLTVRIADPADTQGDGSYTIPVTTLANWMATRGYSA
jgi:hypothetical protein